MTNSSGASARRTPDSAPAAPRGPPPPAALAATRTHSAELVPFTAEPSGAGFSWMGVGFFLGILNLGKALPTPRKKAAPLLPPSAESRARRAGPTGGRGLPSEDGAPREVPFAPRGGGGSWDPRRTRPELGSPRREGAESFPAGAVRQPGIPPSPSVNRGLGLGAPQRAKQARSHRRRGSAAASSPRSQSLGAAVPGRDCGAGEGRGGGCLAPSPGHGPCHTPTRPRPLASPTANASKPPRQMTRKHVTGARRAALGAESGEGSTGPSAGRRQRGGPCGSGGGTSWLPQRAESSSGSGTSCLPRCGDWSPPEMK